MTSTDLVVLSIPGVQRFIAEARTTRDLANGSRLITDLMSAALQAAKGPDVTLIIPASIGPSTGVPNKAVFSVAAGRGASVARAAVDAVNNEWGRRVADLTGVVAPPNFPVVNWVSVTGEGRSYQEQWEIAHQTLAARRSIRSFAQLVPAGPTQGVAHRRVCSVSGRWRTTPPQSSTVPAHDRNERLSAVAWTKRLWSRDQVASTYSIASAQYRSSILQSADPDVMAAARALYEHASRSVPARVEMSLVGDWPRGWRRWIAQQAGPWMLPEAWTSTAVAQAQAEQPCGLWPDPEVVASAGLKAAAVLASAVEAAGGQPCARYLAVIVQDLDSMGKRLSGLAPNGRDGTDLVPTPQWHQQISSKLGELATQQRQVLRDSAIKGFAVYLGGDDLLALVPPGSAIEAARRLRSTLDNLADAELPSASTGIHFFHQAGGLQTAIAEGLSTLAAAKAMPAKGGLGLSYARRSGASARIAFPWLAKDNTVLDTLQAMTRASDADLSPRLQTSLAREAKQLTELSSRWRHIERQELVRLVQRHLNYPPGVKPTPQQIHDDATAWGKRLHTLRAWQTVTAGIAAADPAAGTELGLFLRRECQ